MEIKKLNEKFANKKADEILEYFLKEYGREAAISSSLGAEDQVLTDIALKIDKKANIFTLDTGRLHPQTYDVMDATNLKYGIKIKIFFPKNEEIEKLYQTQGVNGHFESIENRKRCCNIRKMEPLKRALKPLKVWITGLRAAQSVTRADMPIIEWDENFEVIKVNPLINWSEDDVWNYIKTNNVPYNKLHDEGYPSIGCAPCTRAIKKGEDIRAGRWWWENPKHKECGLHVK
ncbi:phosphoadenylyl-sulfate reductase [Halarcobacter anaerophilus]|uniref:Adenosine 5'-phosphosulfate reductase n=1 Tax=Halarcobacter anaerophilus TaxID=877500 RepID=A0A4Q0XYY9_9BACT|nr:phosphoadenylyl-sulfate reductase [Halarcobacter anaerophilus]QDF30371.1 phosphoadenosine phosphosulfate reductase [Halarcobacter anaerophilus]RXJ61539.1 phosphoadenylyl-sulfate reductase [Halarcobacter anaerophilus]